MDWCKKKKHPIHWDWWISIESIGGLGMVYDGFTKLTFLRWWVYSASMGMRSGPQTDNFHDSARDGLDVPTTSRQPSQKSLHQSKSRHKSKDHHFYHHFLHHFPPDFSPSFEALLVLPPGQTCLEVLLYRRLQLRGWRGLSHPGCVGCRAAADGAADAEPSSEGVAQTQRLVVQEVGWIPGWIWMDTWERWGWRWGV